MKKRLIIILLFICQKLFSQITIVDKYGYVLTKNIDIVNYVKLNGQHLAPDYYKVCCTEFLIKVLSKYYKLSTKDLQQISINITDKRDQYNFSIYIANLGNKKGFYQGDIPWGPVPHEVSFCCGLIDVHNIYLGFSKGVVQWIKDANKGTQVVIEEAKEGDLVQFWYPNSYGHCGILKSIDFQNNKITLYSSFPSTRGYGIQEFELSPFTYFARLK